MCCCGSVESNDNKEESYTNQGLPANQEPHRSYASPNLKKASRRVHNSVNEPAQPLNITRNEIYNLSLADSCQAASTKGEELEISQRNMVQTFCCVWRAIVG